MVKNINSYLNGCHFQDSTLKDQCDLLATIEYTDVFIDTTDGLTINCGILAAENHHLLFNNENSPSIK